MLPFSTARTIVPLDDTLLNEVADAPPPPPRTPIPLPMRASEPPRRSDPGLAPDEAPDAVVVYLRQAGLLDDDEPFELITDEAPPVRRR